MDVYSEILINNLNREKYLSKYACKSNKGIRKDPARETISDRLNIRPPFFHDADKILHSRVYSRYRHRQ
jgi:dGTPase